ncbi:MAG TPA: type II toxin-antitoxin system RelE/ParE family toxin [Anaerolineae bacterium]
MRKLRGHQNLYRIRVGDYHIVYEIDDQVRVLWITRIRYRRDVYR